MNESLAILRAAASEEARELETADIVEPGPEPEGLDRALEAFFATEPPTDTWLAVVEDLALQGPAIDSSPSQAAKTAATARPALPLTVEEALRSPRRNAREYVQAVLGLGADAAEEFLERPAAALAQRKAGEVRDLASRAGRPLGELFADIASSWRASSGYVYAYRPGEASETPAVSTTSNDISILVDWGEALLS